VNSAAEEWKKANEMFQAYGYVDVTFFKRIQQEAWEHGMIEAAHKCSGWMLAKDAKDSILRAAQASHETAVKND